MLQQIMLSVRELNSSSLPERNWINEHLSYTHGYGATLGRVNQVTNEGLPILDVKDIPPSSNAPVFSITRPEIYYGELTRGYAIVKTGQEEFDYPSGEENKYTTYSGSGGVPVSSFCANCFSPSISKTSTLCFPLCSNPTAGFSISAICAQD